MVATLNSRYRWLMERDETATALVARLERQLDREQRAREEAEQLLEAKSSELFDLAEKLAEEAQRNESLAAAVEAASDGVALTDNEGRFTYMNRAHAALFGYTPAELLGRPWSVLYTESGAAHFVWHIIPQVMRDGMWRGEALGLSKTGERVEQEVVLGALSDGGLMCTTRDASKRRARARAEKSLQERLSKADRDAVLLTMASAVAHDFNNLTGAISGYAQLIGMMQGHDPKILGYAENILLATSQATDIVRSLNHSLVDGEPVMTKLDLKFVLERSIGIVEALCPETIDIEVDYDDVGEIIADELMVSRSIINVVKNAFEAMPEGGKLIIRQRIETRSMIGEGRVECRLGESDAPISAVLEIIDQGIGIAQDEVCQIFVPRRTTKALLQGTGLGLTSLKMLAETGQATVEIETELEQGTGFRILFRDPSVRSVAPAPVMAAEDHIGATKLLLVEDDEAVGQMMVETLSLLGFGVTWEKDPLKALDLVRTDPAAHALIVTDWAMPRMDGGAFARAVRAVDNKVPMILCSGHAASVADKNMFARIFEKPVDTLVLSKAITRITGLSPRSESETESHADLVGR